MSFTRVLTKPDVVTKGKLTANDNGELFVIVGNDGLPDSAPWEKYWHVFEWRRGSFHRIDPYFEEK